MENLLSNLNLRWWFMVQIVVSVAVFILALTTELKTFDNTSVAFVSMAMFFISMAYFAAVRRFNNTKVVNGYEIESYIIFLEWNFATIILGILGICCLFKGIF